MPLFVLIIVLLIVGVVIGGVATWSARADGAAPRAGSTATARPARARSSGLKRAEASTSAPGAAGATAAAQCDDLRDHRIGA